MPYETYTKPIKDPSDYRSGKWILNHNLSIILAYKQIHSNFVINI